MRLTTKMAKVADWLVEYRDSRVNLEQLAARMSMTWGEFYTEYLALRAASGAETVSGVIAWWLEVTDEAKTKVAEAPRR